MQLPVKITYRGLEKSDRVDNLVLDYARDWKDFVTTSTGATSPSSKPITRIKKETRTGVAST